ncbi:MAG: hypothetical protein OSB34_00990, partial [Planktomarina sp.]|nr:hypothetical protein [Planktomarina sp.]
PVWVNAMPCSAPVLRLRLEEIYAILSPRANGIPTILDLQPREQVLNYSSKSYGKTEAPPGINCTSKADQNIRAEICSLTKL